MKYFINSDQTVEGISSISTGDDVLFRTVDVNEEEVYKHIGSFIANLISNNDPRDRLFYTAIIVRSSTVSVDGYKNILYEIIRALGKYKETMTEEECKAILFNDKWTFHYYEPEDQEKIVRLDSLWIGDVTNNSLPGLSLSICHSDDYQGIFDKNQYTYKGNEMSKLGLRLPLQYTDGNSACLKKGSNILFMSDKTANSVNLKYAMIGNFLARLVLQNQNNHFLNKPNIYICEKTVHSGARKIILDHFYKEFKKGNSVLEDASDEFILHYIRTNVCWGINDCDKYDIKSNTNIRVSGSKVPDKDCYNIYFSAKAEINDLEIFNSDMIVAPRRIEDNRKLIWQNIVKNKFGRTGAPIRLVVDISDLYQEEDPRTFTIDGKEVPVGSVVAVSPEYGLDSLVGVFYHHNNEPKDTSFVCMGLVPEKKIHLLDSNHLYLSRRRIYDRGNKWVGRDLSFQPNHDKYFLEYKLINDKFINTVSNIVDERPDILYVDIQGEEDRFMTDDRMAVNSLKEYLKSGGIIMTSSHGLVSLLDTTLDVDLSPRVRSTDRVEETLTRYLRTMSSPINYRAAEENILRVGLLSYYTEYSNLTHITDDLDEIKKELKPNQGFSVIDPDSTNLYPPVANVMMVTSDNKDIEDMLTKDKLDIVFILGKPEGLNSLKHAITRFEKNGGFVVWSHEK